MDGEATDKMVRWTASTEVGDFVRDSSKGKEFTIQIEGGEQVRVSVPTFADRTRFLRHRLRTISYEIVHKGQLKEECDRLAHRSVQRVALGGFAGLVSWWGTVCVLTFQTSWGWDVMEPVTYLAGLTTVILGYCWFLYHNREVSYHSVLHLTVSKRQIKLYALKGFDLNQWQELLDDGKALRREIKAVAQEYDEKWDESNDEISSDIVKKALDGDGKKGKEDDSDESRSD